MLDILAPFNPQAFKLMQGFRLPDIRLPIAPKSSELKSYAQIDIDRARLTMCLIRHEFRPDKSYKIR